MKRKVLTVLCVMALLLGAFGVTAAAEEGPAAKIGETSYDTLQLAVNAVKEGEQNGLIVLQQPVDSVTIDCDVYVDLNGKDIGSLTVNNGTFYGMDSETDDFEIDAVNHTGYGKIGEIKGNAENVKGVPVGTQDAAEGCSYLMVAEDGIGTSFHCVNLKLENMTLRPNEVGLYFQSNFGGDALVAERVDTFGVALSLKGEPTAENLATDCKLSEFTDFQAGVNNTNTSTILQGVMKETNPKLANRANSQMSVYGRAYVKIDNTYIFGNAQNRSLMDEVVELSKDEANVTDDVVAMYESYRSVMKTWDIEPIIRAYEDPILKVLVVGNSHGLDATNLLDLVFEKEAPNQKVVIGAMYYSGCRIVQHARFAELNSAVYSYHKNGDFTGANEDGSWTVTPDVILSYGLEDEPWDIVVMQEMNKYAGIESSYVAADYQYVIDYIQAHVESDPILAWHLVWSNPDEEQYLGGAGADNELSYTAGWGQEHAQLFPGADGKTFDNLVMYNEMVRLTNKYLVDTTDFLDKKYYDFVIPAGTAVQYAQEASGLGLGLEKLYRDYTHVNDYGRLMAAYVWYAELMEAFTGEKVTLDEIKVDTIPAVLHHKNSHYPEKDGSGDYPVTKDMRDQLLEAVEWALENPFTLPDAQ